MGEKEGVRGEGGCDGTSWATGIEVMVLTLGMAADPNPTWARKRLRNRKKENGGNGARSGLNKATRQTSSKPQSKATPLLTHRKGG